MQSHAVSNARKGVNLISREGWGLSWGFKVCEEEEMAEKATSEMAGRSGVCCKFAKVAATLRATIWWPVY